MRIYAVIVGVLAFALGLASVLQSDGRISWLMVLTGWMPLFVGGGLAAYALFKGHDTPFHRVAKDAMWLLLAGFAAYAGILVYSLFAFPVH